MEEKTYKTPEQQIDILRSRGMVIEDEKKDDVKRILETENYYNIINGYKDLFLSSRETADADEKYKEGMSFYEVYALYRFDREIRSIYFRYLLKIENTFKTVISNEFSVLYGHDNYLKLSNFDTSSEKNIANVIKLFGDIQQETSRQMNKHHQSVTHYMLHHGYIPLWVLVNVLTFGKVGNFYMNMKPDDQTAVSRHFRLVPSELSKFMDMLTLARNKCAHDERFFDIRCKKGIHTKSIKNFDALEIVRAEDGSYTYGTNDAYAIAIIFALILGQPDLDEFIASMNSAFAELEKDLHTISIKDVMDIMGYGSTWKSLPKIL